MAYTYSQVEPDGEHAEAALAEECALAISYNGISHAVMMVSPHKLADFAVGFSLGSGLISSIDDIYDVHISSSACAYSAELTISARAFWNLKRQRRQLVGNSGCGLCGVESLRQALPELPCLPARPLPAYEHLLNLRPQIAAQQSLARHSGALHAALFVDSAGKIALCREDIGRHNALDKLLGALHRQQLSARNGFAVVTSRCSLELIQKAIRSGIGTLATLSAPTALAVDWARQHRLNLIHLPERHAPRIYSPAPAEEHPA
jgi:FdhD protein